MLLNSQLSLVVFGLIFIWLGVLSFLFYKLFSHYQKLTKGITKRDLRSILEKLLKDSEQESRRIDELIKRAGKIEKEIVHDIQKAGLVRFNPFAETGGDQSFCLALLDGEDNGLVISSLHSRDTTRLYAKPVKKGKASGYELSTEERRAIKGAKKIK
jgi:hypothetical protein